MVKSKPMPDSGTNAPVGSALLLTVRLPLCAPALAGANSTTAVQLAPAASVERAGVAHQPEARRDRESKAARLFTLSGLVRVTVTGLLSRPTPVSELPDLLESRPGWAAPAPSPAFRPSR